MEACRYTCFDPDSTRAFLMRLSRFFCVLWMSINRRLQMFLFYFFYTSWNKIVVSDGSSFTVLNKSEHILSENNLLDLSPVCISIFQYTL